MTGRHRLLFVSSRYLFPIDSGGKIRTVNILRGLKGGDFDITLASPLPAAARARQPVETLDICDRFLGWDEKPRGNFFQWTRLRHLASRLPVAIATDYSATGHAVIANELDQGTDVLVVDFPHAAVLVPPPYGCPSVIFTHNVETEIFRRHARLASSAIKKAVWSNQARKMEQYERELLGRFTAVVAVADRDRQFFQSEYGVANVSVIPTGVNLDFFAYQGTAPLEDRDGGTVVFTGSMDWMANIDGVGFFMDAVWPMIARARPRARCLIVGRSSPPALVERARTRGLQWEFTGFVDDVRPFVKKAHVYVIPLRIGGGTRIKVYEAMAMGCPVVSTRIGVEGLPVEHDRHFVEADSADAMAAAILSLLDQRELRERLSRQAREFVEKNMSARVASQVFEKICLDALGIQSVEEEGSKCTNA